ncbi:hypothetical protein [Dactylosporangium sp. NPDC048998]|uniref:hypothetical protein n=1 Tax=Dactylosporangium sp. NPDC048998 TaxID=3363976 RepID=UPI003720AE96
MHRRRSASAITLAALFMAGCTADPAAGPAATTAPASGVLLLDALAHVADSDATRTRFEFSDIAFLGTMQGEGWADIRYLGARNISLLLVQRAGLPVDAASYAITAGPEPRQVIVLAGGQDATTATAALRQLGWRADGDRFLAPLLTAKSPDTDNDGGLIPLGQARQSGADLLVGGTTADLADAAPAAGRPTLVVRPVVAALAGCLGDVVAAKARFMPHVSGPQIYLGVAATGVRRPATPDAKPRVVLCAAHDSAATATQTAETLRHAFANDASNGVPYTQLYSDVTVTVLDGPQHIVRAEATAATPNTMLYAFGGYSLPGEVGQGDV